MLAGALAAILAVAVAQAPPPDDALRAAEQRARSGQVAEAHADLATLLSRTPGQDRSRARILSALAQLENRLGNYAAAVDHAEQAATAYLAAGDRQRAGQARNTVGLARLYAGNYPAAAVAFEAAIVEATAANDWAGHAEQLSNLGNVFYFVGRYDEAARSYSDAMQLTDAHQAESWAARRRSILLANQAALDQRLGRYDAALAVYRTMRDTANAARPEEQAQVLVNQGVLYRRLGDPYKALDAYNAARVLFAAHEHVDGQLGALNNSGIVQALDLGRADDAIDAFTEALALATRAGNRRAELLARLYRGEAALRAHRVDEAATDFEASRVLADTLDTAEEQWKAWYGLGRVRARAGDHDTARADLDRAIGIVEQLREGLTVPSSRADFFQDKREVYDARIALSLASESVDRTFNLVERSRARTWRDRLKLSGDVDLASVRQALPSHTVLLSYWYSAAGAAVMRVTRESASVTIVRVSPASLQRLMASLRQAGSDEWRHAAAELAQELIPERALDGMRRLVVVPDGPLGLIPFEVLPRGTDPLVNQMSVRYLPTSAALLAAVGDRPAWRAPWTHSLVAFGDPLPGKDQWSSAMNEVSRLTASEAEVRDVASLFGGQHRIFVGAENVKTRLPDAIAWRPLVLHLATHGVADSVSAERSRLLFSPAARGAPSDALFLREIYDLPLAEVELVVLSACDTERGPVQRGEGVQGFSRAFLAAGARSAVTTLWRVPDEAAAALMRVFYERLQRGDDRADALAFAKRALIASQTMADAHYWAAFVLTGDAGVVPRTPRWSTLAGGGLLVAGLVLTLVAYRQWR